MRYAKLVEDSDGVSYWTDGAAELDEVDFVPPARPLLMSQAIAAKSMVFLALPAGWRGVQHRSPQRQIAAILSGVFRVEAGSGEVREFCAGDIFWMEDTNGAGHMSSAEGPEPATMVITQLA